MSATLRYWKLTTSLVKNEIDKNIEFQCRLYNVQTKAEFASNEQEL